jgi:hypothetical protein
MDNVRLRRRTLLLSFPLAALLAVASLGGLLIPSAYEGETRLRAAQAMGNDAGNLVLVLPVLLVAAFLARRGSMRALLVSAGTLAYLVYDFAGYAFDVRFNVMFLLYTGVLGLSAFALGASLLALPGEEIAHRHGSRTPVKTVATVLLLLAVATVLHWLVEAVPALLTGQPPQAVRASGHVTEPVAVLDLAFLAPVCFITAILLLRRRQFAFSLGPVLLAFLVLSSVVLVPMGIAMERFGLKAGYLFYGIALGLAAGGGVLLTLSLREAEVV